ncbi:porin [Bradyrhizobium sp.]|uniref:porin n=1 Tax=Bradyrhizobium sp. TaxID=376 RepID=UPI0035240FD7
MWKHINAARCVLGPGLRAVLAIAAFAMFNAAPSHASVEYQRVCSLYGAGFFYIPGTDTCSNARQIVENQFAIARELTRAATGTAMAAALVNPFLPDGTDYAISIHWAVFDGQHAAGFAGLIRLYGNLALSAGVAVGLDNGRLPSLVNRTQTEFGTSVPAQSWSDIRVLGRVGLQYSW